MEKEDGNKRRRELYITTKDRDNEQRRKLYAKKKARRDDISESSSYRRTRISVMEADASHFSDARTNEVFDAPYNPQEPNPYELELIQRFAAIRNVPTESFELPLGSICRHCNAKKFWKETDSFCCMDGQVRLCSNEMPNELRDLFIANTEITKEFFEK